MEVADWMYDGSKQLIHLKVLKESNPVQTADYAVTRGIKDKPSFAWWVPFDLRKHDTIIAAVNTCVKRKSHMYDIEVPTSSNNALHLDTENGSMIWTNSANL